MGTMSRGLILKELCLRRDPSTRPLGRTRSGLASLSDARFQNGKKPMPPPVFCKRVRNRLKAKNLEWKTEYTQNGRVRKSMSRKGLQSSREIPRHCVPRDSHPHRMRRGPSAPFGRSGFASSSDAQLSKSGCSGPAGSSMGARLTQLLNA